MLHKIYQPTIDGKEKKFPMSAFAHVGSVFGEVNILIPVTISTPTDFSC